MILEGKTFISTYDNEPSLDLSKMSDVFAILEDVKRNKDQALFKYNELFDGVTIDTLKVSEEEIKSAYDQLDNELKIALMKSYSNIKAFQQKIKHQNKHTDDEMYQLYHPLDTVGIYVPGGKASYPSTVLMTATLAEVAGVKNIIVVTPPQKAGVNQSVLAACYITGVTHVFQTGGAQAVAALTYGTESIPKADKIVGPGNQYVALAKKLVYGEVGIDSIAGPSEIAIVTDDRQNPVHIAWDCLAQAEHDELARTFVISTSKEMLEQVEKEIEGLIDESPRKAIIEESIKNHHYAVLASNDDEAINIINMIASEHVSIQTENSEYYIPRITRAGALFIGPYAPEAMGDYILGPSHVLPTNGNARFSSGLTVNDFMTSNSVMNISRDTFRSNMDEAMMIANIESLYAHEASIRVRKEDDID